eukprot:SM000253S09045  [mRNA]  locus=s253:89909:93768:- [translate_table: standard]
MVDRLHLSLDELLAEVAAAAAAEAAWEPLLGALLPEDDRYGRLERQAWILNKKFPPNVPRPPLFGHLLGVKDVLRVSGQPTRAGSKLPQELLDGEEATVVKLLRDAGALIMAKCTTTCFGFFNPAHTNNPTAPGHTPGGSSCGPAAAVASGLCTLGVATQTYASISRPAAYCGVVGFKPSHGRLPTIGIIPGSPSLDQPGFFARSVGPLMAVSQCTCTNWRGAATLDSKPKKLGVPAGPLLAKCEPRALAAFETTLVQLSAEGWIVSRVDAIGDFEDIERKHMNLMSYEYGQVHKDWIKQRELYLDELATFIDQGLQVTSEAAEEGRQSCNSLRTALESLMDEYKLAAWIAPGATGPPPKGLASTGSPHMSLPWTHSGLPSITLPSALLPAGTSSCQSTHMDGAGVSGAPVTASNDGQTLAESLPSSRAKLEGIKPEGSVTYREEHQAKPVHLPLAVTLAGRWGSDEELLLLALKVEKALDFHVPWGNPEMLRSVVGAS